MLPLNRPYINYKAESINLDIYFSNYLPDHQFQLLYSARQGLETIYKFIFQTHGSQIIQVSPLTCFEALYPIISNGHKIRFVDIDLNTFNISDTSIDYSLKHIQLIHLGGNPVSDEVYKKLIEANISIIDDAAQAFESKSTMSVIRKYSDFVVFSMAKNMHAIAGGILFSKKPLSVNYCSNPSLFSIIYLKLKRYLESISTYNSIFVPLLLQTLRKYRKKSKSNIIDFKPSQLIINSIESQLALSDILIANRKQNAIKIIEGLSKAGLIFQEVSGNNNVYTRLYCYHPKIDSLKIINSLRKCKIGANHLAQNLNERRQAGIWEHNEFSPFFERKSLPNYCYLHDKIFAIPISANMEINEIRYIIEMTEKTINELSMKTFSIV